MVAKALCGDLSPSDLFSRDQNLFSMAQRNCRILKWNVRGLNDGARRDSVCELTRDTGSTIVCLQETKL